MADIPRPVPIPGGRLNRLARLGGLATGIAGRAAVDSGRAVLSGRRPDPRDLFLTPQNINRITQQLAQMRGAAMKVGQMLSMEASDVLPPELADILARLRADADYMPPKQLRAALAGALGDDFQRRFRSLDPRPVAAASIGQVHRAVTRDGRDIALKVQYPGVTRSIDSDVRNVGALIRMTGMIPKGMDISPLLEAARAQLHEEADYTREAEQLAAFGTRLAGDPRFLVPGVHADLSSRTVLAMDFVESTPLEETDRGQAVTEALIWLFLTELFDWHAMQTDPNFANYRWQADTGRIVLLDFGAARSFDPAAMAPYRDLLRAGFAEDDRAVIAALRDLGFLGESTPERAERVILDLFRTAFSPVTALSHDFATCKMVEQLRAAGMDLVDDRGTFPLPPADALFIQRKIGGMYLLAKRLGATVDLGAIVTPFR